MSQILITLYHKFESFYCLSNLVSYHWFASDGWSLEYSEYSFNKDFSSFSQLSTLNSLMITLIKIQKSAFYNSAVDETVLIFGWAQQWAFFCLVHASETHVVFWLTICDIEKNLLFSSVSFSERNSISKTLTISLARVRIPLMLSKWSS
jgi:hypothetical protein